MARRSKALELLDFEIAFYGKLLSAYPDFVDVLTPLGHAYTRRGLHEQGLAIDLRLTKLRGNQPVTWYNLACSYALLKRVEESLEAFRRSIDLGYRDFDHARRDPDLRNLFLSSKGRAFLQSLIAQRSPHTRQAPTPTPKPKPNP